MARFIVSTQTDRTFDAAEPLPEGDYVARITGAENSVSKAGNNMIVLDLLCDGAERPTREWLVFSPAGSRKITDAVKSCGLMSQLEVEDGEAELDAEMMSGATCKVRLKIEEFDGRKINRVQYWLSEWRDADGNIISDADKQSVPDDLPY